MELAIINWRENQQVMGMFTTLVQIDVRLTAMLESVEQFEFFGNMDRWNTPVLIEDSRSDRTWYGQITHISYNQRANYVELNLRMRCEDPKLKEYKRLNEKYPHTCHLCGTGLFFQELLKANTKITGEMLATLWKREEVEFYCCGCYRPIGKIRRINENLMPWYFSQEYEQNPHPPVTSTLNLISTPNPGYFWAHVRDGMMRPGQLLQRAPSGDGLQPAEPSVYELYGEIQPNHELGIVGRVNLEGQVQPERNDTVDAMAHALDHLAIFGQDIQIGASVQADEIIYDKIKKNKIRRFITKCVKKVIFWTRFWIF